jgi:hypothetical protein
MMKKINLYYILLLVIIFSACEDGLEPKVDNTYGDEDTWRLPEKAEGVLMNAYANVDRQLDGYGNNFLDVATDNAVTNNFGAGLYALGSGSLSPQSNPLGIWDQAYNQFRYIHLFLENGLGENITYILTDNKADSLYKERLKGEAFFLRAWWGFKLLQHYGGKTNEGEALGYPIITRTLTDDEATDPGRFKRNTYEECVEQITADSDSAAYYLPAAYAGGDPVVGDVNLGRATQLAAIALKSRVYTYAASPAYQPDDITALADMGSFTVVNEAEYIAGWERAAQESNAVINEIGNFISLKANHFNAANTPNEYIWRSYHNNKSMEVRNYPPYYYGNGVTGPSQNLVDAFPMQNGYPIDDPRSGYNPQDPYSGRDPRLDLNIFYNGRVLAGEPLETFAGGKDSQQTYQKATRTGYYLRKWLSTADNMLDPESPQNDHHYNARLRKTEIYLNFAEASNEAWGPTTIGPGCNQSALDVISAIRSTAGINSDDYLNEIAGQGKSAFRSLIQNERRVELAFENHRFFDMRRWLLKLDEPVRGMKITREEDETLSFEPFVVEERNMSDIRYYYLPLPYQEVVKSPGLVQNMGW